MASLLRRGFDSAVLLLSWRLWKERKRNARTFDNVVSSIVQVAQGALDEADQWVAAGFSPLSMFFVGASAP